MSLKTVLLFFISFGFLYILIAVYKLSNFNTIDQWMNCESIINLQTQVPSIIDNQDKIKTKKQSEKTFRTKQLIDNKNEIDQKLELFHQKDRTSTDDGVSAPSKQLTAEHFYLVNANVISSTSPHIFYKKEEKLAKTEGVLTNTPIIFKRKLILIYTPLFGNIPWKAVPYNYKFTELDQTTPCQVNMCKVTYDKNDLNVSDAVLFHGRDLPSPQVLRDLRKKHSKQRQIWIWFIHEAPPFSYLNLSEYDDIFNWTATYRPSSNVFIPYFAYRKLQSKEDRPQLGTNFAEGKDHMILAMLSHCDKDRISFIHKLKEYIPVDVYGGCKSLINPNIGNCQRNTKTCQNITKRYKFYLALENSLCEDYITEKYFKNSLLSHLIPIVLGKRANYQNSKIAIPNTYIDIEKFKNLEEFSNYMKYLDKNITAYNEYFQWRYNYKVELQQGMCKVCKALWDTNNSPTTESLVKLSEFWNPNLSCSNMTAVMDSYV